MMVPLRKRRKFLFPCEFCDKKYKIFFSLTRHLIEVHPEKYPFNTCTKCKNTFQRKNDYDDHESKCSLHVQGADGSPHKSNNSRELECDSLNKDNDIKEEMRVDPAAIQMPINTLTTGDGDIFNLVSPKQEENELFEAEYLSDKEDVEFKLEYEENLGVIAPESDEASHSDEASPSDAEEKVDICLASLPIVFTTRLDDMHILRTKDDSMSLRYITNIMIKESCPKYCNQKPTRKPHSKASYRALQQKINEINKRSSLRNSVNKESTTTNSEDDVARALSSHLVTLRNARLLKKCKPLSVVLEKLEIKEGNAQSRIIKKRSRVFGKKSANCFVFQDYSDNETDIFCIENSMITEMFTLKSVRDDTVQPHVSAYLKVGMSPRIIKYCCWYQRESFLTTLDLAVFDLQVKEFMKKPHNCQINLCTCCCRSRKGKTKSYDTSVSVLVLGDIKNMKPRNVTDAEIKVLENEISETFQGINRLKYGYINDWFENLMDKKKPIRTVVTLALSYNRPLLKKTLSNLAENTKNNEKTYELQEQGKHIYTIPRKYKTIAYLNYPKKIENEICCWYGREKHDILSNTTSPIRFFKVPHNCLPNNCICCCKPQKTVSLLKNTTGVQTKLYVPSFTTVRKKQNAPPKLNNKMVETSSTVSAVAVVNYQLLTKSMPQKILSETYSKPVKTLPKTQMNKHKNKNVQPTIKSIKTQKTILPKVPSYQSSNKQPLPSPDIEQIDDNTQDLAESLISSILNRFKDVRLTINEEGKVAAALNAPAESLSVAELKVLANILAHADKQVKALGLDPGESVHRKPQHNLTAGPESAHDQNQLSSRTIRPKEINSQPNPEILGNFSHLSQCHNEALFESFSSYVESKQKATGNKMKQIGEKNTDDSSDFLKISNVVSLRNAENSSVSESGGELTVETSVHGAWSNSRNCDDSVTPKRKLNDSESQQTPLGKIRVVPPTKLGIPESVNNPQPKEINGTIFNPQFFANFLQPNMLSNSTVIPSVVLVGSNNIQSLPVLNQVTGNAVIIPGTSANTSNQQNIFVINPLYPQRTIAAGNSSAVQVSQPIMNMNTVAQNIQVMSRSTATSVFHISNLNNQSIAKPQLLNAEPVLKTTPVPTNTTSPAPKAIPKKTFKRN